MIKICMVAIKSENKEKIMKLKFILVMMISLFNSMMAMRIDNLELEKILIELPTLKFKAAWAAISSGKNLKAVGEPNIKELGKIIREIQCWIQYIGSEKKLIINLANSPNLTADKIKEYFPDLFRVYRAKNKEQLLNVMLIDMVEQGHKEIAKLLIALGADANAQELYGLTTPLSTAVYYGHKKIVKMLIDSGAKVNAEDIHGRRSLELASKNNFKDIVQLLLNAGADANARYAGGDTALMIAAQKGYKEIVQILLNAGANINAQDMLGSTALMLAAYKGHAEVVRTLLHEGADVNIKITAGIKL